MSIQRQPTLRQSSTEEDSSRGNILVICRFRPMNPLEHEHSTQTCVQFGSDEKSVQVNSGYDNLEPLTFSFDKVFAPDSSQSSVYQVTGRPIVDSILEGFNGTVLAYGQTSSGKTYTMTGSDLDSVELQGITPRMVRSIFDAIEAAPNHIEFTVKVGYCELYMERIKDLLDPSRDNLKIHEDKARGIYIANLTEEYVSSEIEVKELMKFGTANRAVGETRMNQGSSRSHSLFMLTVAQHNTLDLSAKSGKLILVDLAGSEKVNKTGAEGLRLSEAKTINQSLSSLGKVIKALTDGSRHIPYRDSKLTRVLQDSLGGNSKTALIVTCSPSVYNHEETLSTLRFGIRAKAIKNKPKVNREFTVAEMKLLLAKAEAEILDRESKIFMLSNALKEAGITDIPQVNMIQVQEDEEKQEVQSSITENLEKLSHAESQISQLSKDLQDAQSENEILQNRIMELNYQLQTFEDKYKDFEEQNEKLINKNQFLEQEKAALIQSNQQLTTCLQDRDEMLRSQQLIFDNQVEMLTRESSKLNKELLELKSHLPNGTQMFSSYISVNQQELEDSRKTISTLQDHIINLEEKLKQTQKAKQDSDSSLKIKMNSLERNLEQLTFLYQQIVTQKSTLFYDVQAFEKKIERKNQRISNLENQIKQLKEQLSKYKKHLAARNSGRENGEILYKASNKIKKMIRGGQHNSRVLSFLMPSAQQKYQAQT